MMKFVSSNALSLIGLHMGCAPFSVAGYDTCLFIQSYLKNQTITKENPSFMKYEAWVEYQKAQLEEAEKKRQNIINRAKKELRAFVAEIAKKWGNMTCKKPVLDGKYFTKELCQELLKKAVSGDKEALTQVASLIGCTKKITNFLVILADWSDILETEIQKQLVEPFGIRSSSDAPNFVWSEKPKCYQ